VTRPFAGGPRAEGDASIAAGSNFGIASTGPHAINTIVQRAEVPKPVRVDAPLGTHNLPVPAAGLFVGREEDLADLDVKLAVGGGVIGQAVHGLGGVGKTTLALRFARQHLSEFPLVWWVSAETADLLTDGVAELGRRLTSVPGLVDAYRWAVGWLQCHDGWLLVLDNVEDPAILRDLLGAVHGHGRALVTTRRDLAAPVWGRLGLAPLRLGVLDRAASVELLVGLTGRIDERAEAALLAGELGDLPLALEQAGAFIAQEQWTIAGYRQELASRPERAYATAAEGFDTHHTVDRVWTLTMDRAAGRADRTRWVMSILANLAPEPLPISVLRGNDSDAQATEDAVRVLASYSMLNRTGGTVDVHRLVQAVTRAHDPDQTAHRESAARLLAQVVPPDPLVNVAGWPMWKLLLPHIDTLNTSTPADQRSPYLLDMLDKAATYRQGQGQLDRAIPLFEQVLSDRLRIVGADDPDSLGSRDHLAVAYRYAGRLAEAIELHEQVVADSPRVLGADHPNTLNSRNNLAGAFEAIGRLAEAIELYEQVVADSSRVLGADHPNTLNFRSNLAGALEAMGRLAEAIELYEQVVADRMRVLGADHPDTLLSRNNVAYAYRAAGRPAEAIPPLEQVVADSLRVLGPDHPDTLNARNNVAYTYQKAGRLVEAVELFERVLADRLRVFGADHLDTLAARNNLAVAYEAAGRLVEAVELFEQVIVDRLRVLGADHPNTLNSRNNLAYTYGSAGRLAEAIGLFEPVIADRLRVLGPNHPDTLNSRNHLARIYQAAGRQAEAVELSEQVIADSLRVLGPDHPNTLLSRNNLARIYQAAGRLAEAVELYERLAADSLRVLGADHPDTAIYLENLKTVRRAGRQELGDVSPRDDAGP
jgi:tetratricopeptide (TPR) repeat protein